MLHHIQRLLGIAGTGWNHRTAQRARRAVHDKTTRREVIAECIQHNIAFAKSRRKSRTRATPEIRFRSFRFKNRTGRREQSSETGKRFTDTRSANGG